MRALIQRVSSASVEVEGAQVSAIGKGLLVFLGVVHADDEHRALKNGLLLVADIAFIGIV